MVETRSENRHLNFKNFYAHLNIMHLTGLATVAYLSVCVSGAAVFRNATGLPVRKRQVLGGLGLLDTTTTRIPVYPPTATSTIIPTHLVALGSLTKTLNGFPDLGVPPGTVTSTRTVSSASTSPSLRTYTPPSSAEPPIFSPTPHSLSEVSSPAPLAALDMTSWKPTVAPSSTPTAVPASAASTNSVWKTVGISVLVVTLVCLTILLAIFYEQWTSFLRDVFLCRHSHRDQDPLGDEDFFPGKHHENYDDAVESRNRKWTREIRASARLSNMRYPTDLFYGEGSALGPGKAGIGAGGGSGFVVGEFGQLGRPSRPSFLQRLSMLSLRSPYPVSPGLRTKDNSSAVGNADDGITTPVTLPTFKISTS